MNNNNNGDGSEPPVLTATDTSSGSSGSSGDDSDDIDNGYKSRSSDTEDPPSQESDAPPLLAAPSKAKSEPDLREQGNKQFKEGNYQRAIQKYEEALRGRCDPDDKVKCYSNIAHCYNKKLEFKKALDYSFRAIESKPDFWRAYTRCVDAFIGEGKPRMAAVAWMKAEASITTAMDKKQLMDAKPKLSNADKNFAETYVSEFHNNRAKDINLRSLSDKGFNKKQMGKKQSTKSNPMPALVASDADDSNSDADSDSFPLPPTQSRAQKKPPSALAPPSGKSKQAKKPGKEKRVDEQGSTRQPPGPGLPENKILVKFQKTVSEASQCFMNNMKKRSKDMFGEAIETLLTNYERLEFKEPYESSEDVVVIKFIYARACTGLATYQDIILAHDVLKEIHDKHREVRFPAVYLGFALLFVKLNRYDEAMKYLDKGTKWFEMGFSCDTKSYPGHPSKPIEETDPIFLQNKLNTLKVELRHPPPPDAICRYSKCLELRKHHIIPSEKIYITDPDFRPFYKILCRSNCVLEYHDSCWAEKKAEFKVGMKIPSEKEFCGMNCLTPDCEGIIIKFILQDSPHGEPKVIEDKKLIEKIVEEEKMRKEAEKSRKEKEALEYQKNLEEKNNKKKAKKKRPERSKSSSEKDNSRDDEIPKTESFIPDNNQDYSIVSEPLENMRILKKTSEDKENEGDVEKKKVKKNKEKNTIPLDIFNGPNNAPDELNSYSERINRLQSIKRSVEVGISSEGIGAAAVPQARLMTAVKDHMEDIIKNAVEEKLREFGPLKGSDKRLTNFDEETNKYIMEKKGLINVLKTDERFGSYGKFICLKSDAEKAKKLSESEEKSKSEEAGGKSSGMLNLVKTLREKHGFKAESYGLAQAALNPSELEKVRRDAEESVMINTDKNSRMPEYKETRSEFAQTEIFGLELDDGDDLLTLQQNVRILTEELQETKDKLFKIQNEKKLENREAMEKINTLTAEKLVLDDEIVELKETIRGREAMVKDATRKDKEIKKLKDLNEASAKENTRLESQLQDSKSRLENELKVTYQLQLNLQKMTEKDVTIERLKLKCLQSDFDDKKRLLQSKKSDTQKLITQLAQLEIQGQSQAAAVRAAIEKLNQFSAELFAGLDELQMKYDERRVAIEQNKSNNLDLEFVMERYEGPSLDIIEIDTMKQLASISLNKRHAQPPFPPRSPLGPPPGLQPGEMARIQQDIGGFRPSMAPGPALHQSPPPINLPPPQRPAFGNSMAVGSPVRQKPVGPAGRMTPVLAPAAPAVAPVGAPGSVRGAVGPGVAEKRIKSTQKLIISLRTKMPELSIEQADRYIQILREKNNGKLSGLSVNDIMLGVEKLWKKDVGENVGFGAVGRGRHNPVVGGARHVPDDTEDDTECIICMGDDQMDNTNSRQLKPCNHRFHHSCIMHWLQTQGGAGNTCPICRNFIVDETSYPGLGQIAKQFKK